MNFFVVIIFLLVAFFIWIVWGFLKYKLIERGNKVQINFYLSNGLSLFDSIKKALQNLNKSRNLGLKDSTIKKVSEEIADLKQTMNINNIIEIYSTFIHRYIFRDGRKMRPTNLMDEKIIYAAENLNFNEKNGFFVIKPDKGEDFEKKYPN